MVETTDGAIMKLRNRVKTYRKQYPEDNRMIGVYIDELEVLLDHIQELEDAVDAPADLVKPSKNVETITPRLFSPSGATKFRQ